MCTNTYLPHVGGVARSVARFAAEFRRLGHEVWVVAPEFENAPEQEHGVLRFPAVQHFNGSDFSIPVPVPGKLSALLENFHPDIVHAPHPFLLGDLALRVAAARNLPVVFTHHTRYELYTHYVPGDSKLLKRFVVELTSGYCNLCDAVIVPSKSVEELLRRRQVTVPIEVIPTGLDDAAFEAVGKAEARAELGIPLDAFVVGHVGRLAPEKNLEFLADAVQRFLLSNSFAHFLLIGEGPSKGEILARLDSAGLGKRLHQLGIVRPEALVRAYRAMDVFAFASRTETQGLVLTEAMAARVPVVAIDAPGVREVVTDGVNGRLLHDDEPEAFADALAFVASLDPQRRESMARAAEETARRFSMSALAQRAMDLYAILSTRTVFDRNLDNSVWNRARRRIAEEWRILRNIAHATAGAALHRTEPAGGES
jgi:glycosyltransferase involved in cell wall biosynthesis